MRHHGSMGRAARALVALLGVSAALGAGAWPRVAEAQRADCPLKVRPKSGSTGYQNRDTTGGVVCEGMFIGEQSVPLNVRVVSLLKGGLGYALGDSPGNSQLYVHLPPSSADLSPSQPVVVQGRARRANLNWALDATVRPGSSGLPWDLDWTIHPEALPGDQLGLFGQIRTSELGDPLFVPVVVSRSRSMPAAAPGPIALVIHIPGAARVQWFDASSRASCPGQKDACHEVKGTDGYFAIPIPRLTGESPGILPIGILWRARGRPAFNDIPELLRIYRW